jgi:eukaryotic-like serine/threonine-protein kinase
VNALNMHRIEHKGELSSTSAVDVLRFVEKSRQTARVWFETEIGMGQVAFFEGRVVVAEVGLLRRRSALLRLLSMTEGQYSIEVAPVPAAHPIVPSIESALAAMVEREQEWRELCESTPPMGSVLRLTAAGKEYKLQSKGSDRLVYLLVDGRRTLMEILGDAALDPIDALRIVVRGVQLVHFAEVASTNSLLPLPVGEQGGEVIRFPPPPSVPRLGAIDASPIQVVQSVRSNRLVSSDDFARRMGTLSGLGAEISSSSPPPRSRGDSIEAAPIISVSGDPSSSGRRGHIGENSGFRPVEPESKLAARAAGGSAEHLAAEDAGAGPISEPADSLIGSAAPLAPEDNVQRQAGNRVRFVGRYEVIERIGRGGMGSVYLSRLTTQGGFRRLFALKLLRSHLATDGDAAEAFLAEARLAGQLHHPNVVSVVDAGVHERQPYLVMDYVEGCSLRQLMSAYLNERPARVIVPIILDALEGLHAVHSLRADDDTPLEVVHCDVSPENLLIGTDGGCRLTDFGVARRARIGCGQSTHGKPSYLAPEQVTGGPIDRRVDIFAMGIVLWTALTGERLFHASTVEETVQRVCSLPIALPSGVGLRPSSAFDSVCMRALERDPDKRFATAEEMHHALREAALSSGALGLASDVASWVRTAVGRELTQRRLVVLEASRPTGTSTAPPPRAELEQEQAPFSVVGSSAPPPGRRRLDDDSRTIRLTEAVEHGRATRVALLISAVLAAGLVLVSILWPAALSRLFRINLATAPSTASSIQIRLPLTPAEAASGRAHQHVGPDISPVDSKAPPSGASPNGLSNALEETKR